MNFFNYWGQIIALLFLTPITLSAQVVTPLTISNAQATNNEYSIFYQYQFTGDVKYFRVYIDTDRVATTGYTFGGIGADYIIENGNLYKYSGTGGSNWGWTSLGALATYSTSSGLAKFSFNRMAIGETALSGESSDLVFQVQDSLRNYVVIPKYTQNFSSPAPITAPQIDRFEPIAIDGLQPGNYPDPGSYPYVSNAWGAHMPRLVRTNDGSIYVLYLHMSPTNTPMWSLLKRDPLTTHWSKILDGTTSDDTYLLRDPVSDRVHVVAYPDGLPAYWSSPKFIQQPIPGAWQVMTTRSRHYGNAGIGANGTVCLKASHEFPTPIPTSNTTTDYACATSANGTLTWGNFVAHQTGNRYAYDYIFPGVAGLGLYGSSQSDLYKDAANYPTLTGFPYVFNGVRGYSSPIDSDVGLNQYPVFSPLTVSDQSIAQIAPLVKQHEAYVDSRNRAFSIAYESSTDGISPLVNHGVFLSVTNPKTGSLIFRGSVAVPTYGYNRIVEDAKGNLYLLWTNLGTKLTEVAIYKINEAVLNGVTTFSLGTNYNLSSTFAKFAPGWAATPYAISGAFYLAAPRGGTARSNYIEGYMNTCTTQFTTPTVSARPNITNCFNADNKGQMNVIYMRIRLPD